MSPRAVGALLIVLGATFAIFTGVVGYDRLVYGNGIDNARAIPWLIGSGLWVMIVGAALVIVDARRD